MVQALKRRSGSRAQKQERLEARVTPEQKRLLERAAELRGTTLTEFVVASAQQAARDTIQDFEVLTLRDEARKVFVNAVLNPPAPNAAARAAAQRYKEQLEINARQR
jgi:uncharacterized protein (DUF1778 family)